MHEFNKSLLGYSNRILGASQVAQNLPASAGAAGDCRFNPWVGKMREMATQSGILAWEIPWTEEPGGLQSVELQ